MFGCCTKKASPSLNALSLEAARAAPKWVCLLLDTTDSMRIVTSMELVRRDGASPPRHDVMKRVVYNLVTMLGNKDGVRVFTFADGVCRDGTCADPKTGFRGVWTPSSPADFEATWGTLQYGGRTHIMGAWRAIMSEYVAFCAALPSDKQRPVLVPIVITDGELGDGPDFEAALAAVCGSVYVEVGVLGDCDDGDRAMAHYKRLAAESPHVQVTRLLGTDSVFSMCDQLARVMGSEVAAPPTTQLAEIVWPPPSGSATE